MLQEHPDSALYGRRQTVDNRPPGWTSPPLQLLTNGAQHPAHGMMSLRLAVTPSV